MEFLVDSMYNLKKLSCTKKELIEEGCPAVS